MYTHIGRLKHVYNARVLAVNHGDVIKHHTCVPGVHWFSLDHSRQYEHLVGSSNIVPRGFEAMQGPYGYRVP